MKIVLPLIGLSLGAGLAHGSLIYSGAGNGNTTFGGFAGDGSLAINFDGNTFNSTLTRGSGDFNDALVIYFDTVAGGFSNTSGLTDTADGLRSAIAGPGSDLAFPAGFGADYAIALAPGESFGGLWVLDNGANYTFGTNVNLSPNNDATAASYTFDWDLADLGISYGDSVDFITTYTATSGFRSGEAIGNDVSGTVGFNPFTSSNTQSFVAVPEASEALIILLGMTGLVAGRRRKS